MIKRKNLIKLIIIFVLTIIISIVLIRLTVIDINKIICEKNDFQYNAISMSSVIGGFLFTGISILISAIDKERIKRLWNNGYLDNLYSYAIVGMIANVITILVALMLLMCNSSEVIQKLLICIEIITIIMGIVFFVCSIKMLIFILRKMKN